MPTPLMYEKASAKRDQLHGLILTLAQALKEADDLISSEHQNFTNGDWDDDGAKAVHEQIEAALKAVDTTIES